jgi:phosphoserine phosphatase
MRGELDFAASLRERVATLAGLEIAEFEGGFHELLDPLAERLGLDFCRANRLEVEGGRLTGAVDGAIVDARAKAAALEEWAAASGIPLEHTIAVGDGANDLQMLGRARLGVAFCAKPVVRAQADVAIDSLDLSGVLPLIGLRG